MVFCINRTANECYDFIGICHNLESLLIIINSKFLAVAGLDSTTSENSLIKFSTFSLISHLACLSFIHVHCSFRKYFNALCIVCVQTGGRNVWGG